MTVASQVKQTMTSLKGAEQQLITLASKSEGKEAEKAFYEAANILKDVVADLTGRIGELEREEPQYKGF